MSKFQASMVRTIISDLEDHIYKARLLLETSNGILEIDSRPSDAIILALKCTAPIFVEESVVAERLRLADSEGQDPDSVWQRLQEIKPEDLNTQSL